MRAKRAFPRLLAVCARVRVDGDVVAPRLALTRRGEWHGVAIAARHYGALTLHRAMVVTVLWFSN